MKYVSKVLSVTLFILILASVFSNILVGQKAKATVTLPVEKVPRKEYTLIAENATIEIKPGTRVNVWTYNGTVPGPTLRFTEGDTATIHFINKTPMTHTIHFHGQHADVNDGVRPQIRPGWNYTYNFTAEPAGLLMYHCHAFPTSQHIRMGMYGAIIVDSKQKQLQPAREFLLVMSEYDPTDQKVQKGNLTFVPEYYPINGYYDAYMNNPLVANYHELVRFYVINIGVTMPYSFHLHSTTFKVYPSGLISNTPINAQSFSIGPGDAAIVEARWKYPGVYLFHSHGIEEERGNMGEIELVAGNGNATSNVTNNVGSNVMSTPLTKSMSMIDWQYELQKKLQKPIIQLANENPNHGTQPSNPDNMTTPKPNLFNNTISIVSNAANVEQPYSPSPVTVPAGTTISWINDDSIPHTVTSTNSIFDSGFMPAGGTFSFKFEKPGVYNYFCSFHSNMKGTVMVK
jgi:nitrite reductase (NO-forming)